MIAVVTREVRFLLITAVLVAAAVVGFYFLARQVHYGLAERPYIAAVRSELRALAAAQGSFRVMHSTYTKDIAAVRPSASRTAGVRLEILQADSGGFLGEGRHVTWPGRCLIALGRHTGDSLTAGEPWCDS